MYVYSSYVASGVAVASEVRTYVLMLQVWLEYVYLVCLVCLRYCMYVYVRMFVLCGILQNYVC